MSNGEPLNSSCILFYYNSIIVFEVIMIYRIKLSIYFYGPQNIYLLKGTYMLTESIK